MPDNNKIFIVIDNIKIKPEIEYVCRLMSSIFQVEFISVVDDSFESNNKKVVYYFSGSSSKLDLADNSLLIRQNQQLWDSYLRHEVIGKASIEKLILSLSKKRSEDFTGAAGDEDIFFAIIFLISRYEEVFSAFETDQHGRFCYRHDTLASGGIDVPIVNRLLREFTETVSRRYRVPIRYRQVRPVAVISHDIDHPFYYKKLINEASYFFKSVFNQNKNYEQGRFRKALLHAVRLEEDPYDTYAYLNREESGRQIKSTFFLLMSRESRWGLDLKKYRRRLRMLVRHGHEIALHPGYDSFNDFDLTKKEKQKVRDLSDERPVGTRSHFLRFETPGTCLLREELGFSYDSTLGFAEQAGFRGGVCTPFKVFDPLNRRELDILEIPLAIMDGVLRDHMQLSPEQGLDKIREIVDNVHALNGVVVFNWHNSFFLGAGQAWKIVYEKSLDYLCERGFQMTTCADLAQQWNSVWKPR